MNLVSAETRRTIRHSLQTFVVAVSVIVLAIILTFLEDFCVMTKRPPWLVNGIEVLSVILFIGDGLVIVALICRIVFVAVRGVVDDMKSK